MSFIHNPSPTTFRPRSPGLSFLTICSSDPSLLLCCASAEAAQMSSSLLTLLYRALLSWFLLFLPGTNMLLFPNHIPTTIICDHCHPKLHFITSLDLTQVVNANPVAIEERIKTIPNCFMGDTNSHCLVISTSANQVITSDAKFLTSFKAS